MKSMVILSLILACFFSKAHVSSSQNRSSQPVKMAVMGLSHGHASWIFTKIDPKEIQVVGIYEPDIELANSFAKTYGLNRNLFFDDAAKMLFDTKPEGVLAFGSVFDHRTVVELAAPRGIHVMVEKPLSAWNNHGIAMRDLAVEHKIHLLTNYETSWYPTTEKTYQMAQDTLTFGPIRKAVFHHGHRGPKEIGVSQKFLDWLTDPFKSGGGALIDFGCYGANIMTYLMEGKKPISVTAVTQNFKPQIYTDVDDEAAIILDYGNAQAIIQASWNWPFDRKDMEVYGKKGYIITENNTKMRYKSWNNPMEQNLEVQPAPLNVYTDPFKYFADVIRGKIKVEEFSPYSLSNNMIVVEILDAARRSAESNETVFLEQ